MGWIYVFLAGLFEIGFTISLKLSQNFSVLLPSLTFVVCAAASFGLLTQAMCRVDKTDDKDVRGPGDPHHSDHHH